MSIAEFSDVADAQLFWRAKGERTHSICAGVNLPYRVRPRTDAEIADDLACIEDARAEDYTPDDYTERGLSRREFEGV